MHYPDFAIAIEQSGRTAWHGSIFLHSSFFGQDRSYTVTHFCFRFDRNQRDASNNTVAHASDRQLCWEDAPCLTTAVIWNAWQHACRRFLFTGCINRHSRASRQRIIGAVPYGNAQTAICRSFCTPSADPAGRIDQIADIIFQDRVRLKGISAIYMRKKSHILPQIPRLPNPSV